MYLFVRWSVDFEGCSDDFMYLFLFFLLYIHLSLVHGSCDHFDIHCIYILYILMNVLSPIFTCVVSFLSLCTCFLLLVCNLLFLFHTKIP